MEEKKFLLIYHREDNDGVFSAAIFYNYLVSSLNVPEDRIELMGADYNQLGEFSKAKSVKELHGMYTDVIMTDISFNDAGYMKKLWDEFGSRFVWCDHHAPIISLSHSKNFDDVPGVRQTDRSAILCVWKFLYDPFDEAYGKKEIPELLRILSAWDSWTYERENYDREYVMDVNRGVTVEFNLDIHKAIKYVVDVILPDGDELFQEIGRMFSIGYEINRFIERDITNIIRDSGDFGWVLDVPDSQNRKAVAIFHMGATNSTMFETFKDKVQNGIVFKHQKNDNWTVSLYNTDDSDEFHCGEYMRMYKGGGHKGAAGCTLTEEQFIEVLKSKSL